MRVSLGLDKNTLLTGDRTTEDILEKTGLQEPSPPRWESLHTDMQQIRLPANGSGRRGDRINRSPKDRGRAG